MSNPETQISQPVLLSGRENRLAAAAARLLGQVGWPVQLFALCGFIAVMNRLVSLKDREIYTFYFDSLNSCEALGCLLISDDVRSPIFLSIIIAGQRIGLDFDTIFTLISVTSLLVFASALRQEAGQTANARFLLVTLTLGTWLYLIQVKLFLAVALYMLSRVRPERTLRIALVIASVLTHESILFFIGLYVLWEPGKIRLSPRSIAVFAVIAVLLVSYLGATTNVFVSSLQRIQRYNDFAARGEVPAMARISLMSAFFLLFGMSGLLRLRLSPGGGVSWLKLKAAAWMFLPWVILMVFAANALFATRLAELALLHAFLVVPLGRDFRLPSRLLLLVFAGAFGALTFFRDVIFA